MSSTAILGGLALAAVGFTGRFIVRNSKVWADALEKQLKAFPASALSLLWLVHHVYALDGHPKIYKLFKSCHSFANSKYYKGGFESKMNRREAGLVLGVSPSASKNKIKEAHKRIMLLNHPDRGGSPYLAAKINEAKDILDKS